MSETSDRGKEFEGKVAKMIRSMIDRHARRNKGSHANWNRRSDVYTELPIHIECKDQDSVRIKEWFAQAEEASFGKTPVVAWQMENEVMATLRFTDLLNLFVEIADQKLEIEDLRQPVGYSVSESRIEEIKKKIGVSEPKMVMTDGTLKRTMIMCKNGHICTAGRNTCQTKNCQYSSTYIKPKAIKEKK